MDPSTHSLSSEKAFHNIVEIKLWEIFLLYHPAQLYKTLTEHSLDNGPIVDDHKFGRITFRFKAKDWEANIQELLSKYRIPVIVHAYDTGNSGGSVRSVLR